MEDYAYKKANFRALFSEVKASRKPANDLLEDEYFLSRGQRICSSKEHDPENAKDLFQEACLRALKSWKASEAVNGNIENEEDFFAWFDAVARNRCRDEGRKKKRQQKRLGNVDPRPVEEHELASPSPDPCQIAMSKEIEEIIDRAKAQMSDLERQVFEQWLSDEKSSSRKIGAIVGLSHPTVIKLLKSALDRLRDSLPPPPNVRKKIA
jgi:RNA polymerase sigma factor (sigma-70 family)